MALAPLERAQIGCFPSFFCFYPILIPANQPVITKQYSRPHTLSFLPHLRRKGYIPAESCKFNVAIIAVIFDISYLVISGLLQYKPAG
jgi:hypothetical protein